MATNELYHHGIIGQKWGVRRYQNSDGSYTSLGKKRKNASKTRNAVDDIIRTLTDDELDKIGMNKGDEYLSIDQGQHLIKRSLQKVGDIPVSFFDALEDENTINVVFATRNDQSYRGKGYASKSAQQTMDWLDKHPEARKGKKVIWGVREDNQTSIGLAKKLGFAIDNSSRNNGWVNYVKSYEDHSR